MVELFLIALVVLVLGWLYFVSRDVNGSQDLLYDQRTSPDAQVRGKCMIREWYYEAPGVAQIMEGTLTIVTVLGGEGIKIPLDQVKLVRFRRTNIFGSYGWFRKSIFTLDTPKTKGLQLGFANPEPWLPFFKSQQPVQ